MLRSRDISNLLSQPFTESIRGRARFMKDKEARSGSGSTARTRQFAADMVTLSTPEVERYNHPAQAKGPFREEAPLSSAEQAWLQGLPMDPTQVTFDDAQALATMADSVPSMKYPGDRRLVDSVWDPVRELHDRHAAQTQLRNARRPQPPIPTSAMGALADALAAEHPDLEPDETIFRAGRAIDDARARRDARQAAAVNAAETALAELNATIKRRTAVIV